MALSDDLRQRVVDAVVSSGLWRNEAARRFKVSIASAVRWVKLYLTTGEISPKPAGRRPPLRADRGASQLSFGPDPPHAGHHAVGDPAAASRKLRRAFLGLRVVALLRSARITFKKKRRTPRSSSVRTC